MLDLYEELRSLIAATSSMRRPQNLADISALMEDAENVST